MKIEWWNFGLSVGQINKKLTKVVKKKMYKH